MRAVIPGATGLSAIHHRDAEGTLLRPSKYRAFIATETPSSPIAQGLHEKGPEGP
ncbi:hypothetical protein QYQ99_02085 [Comamonas testosteroni]|uniref:hypothetical protein n=1 Tax=Comamonas testosteroni TaxID=285 RepID=UPI00265DAA70|nr:hypothetical protein [Comamonas testosteroni]WKL16378.1 hypothetical protein QYQ99_02085 [Comamonas testosteroni]WQD45173.1 hypothetical protein U0024_10600 [Comamonas testosteroni]